MKERTELSYAVTERLLALGFEESFAELVGSELNTDFTARQMLGYLREVRPHSPEEVADELLGILELRDSIVRKKMAR